jgi:microcystin-dependent protein
MSSIYDWSLSAANNGNADASINFAEGQAPSTVNNSARVLMSRVKEFLLDLGGAPIAAGTANAITVTVNSPFSAFADGIRIAFRAVETNTGATTINVNSIGSKPVVKFTNSGETALIGQEIQDNCIHELVYCSILNGGAGAWLLLNPIETAVRAGTGAPYFGGSVPNGWLLCNGAAVSRATYSALFVAIGTVWGAGNGTTTFNVPNAQNDFLRGASGTIPLGTRQGDLVGSHQHTGSTNGAGAHAHTFTIWSGDGGRTDGPGGNGTPNPSNTIATSTVGDHAHSFTTNAAGGAETRPRNLAVNWIIKT